MWHPHHQQHRHTSHASPSSSSSSTSTSSPHQHQQQQQQQQLQEQQQQLYQQQQHSPFASNSNGIGNSASRRCAPQSPPHARRPLLRFPPPPAYPPPGGVVAESAAAALAAGAHQQYWRAATLAQCADNVGAVNTSVAAVAAHRPTRHSSTGRAAVTPSDMQSSTSPEPWADSESVVRFDPNDYSYAYYEPGPATRHVNVPAPPLQRKCSSPMSSSSTTSTPGTSRARTLDSMPGTSSEPHPRSICSRPSRHTYMTRYGTQENIYEEITDMARYGSSPPAHHVHHGRLRSQHEQSLISLSQSLVEEEVRRVQSRHRRILGELNLSVEAMLMPSPSSNEGSDEADRDGEHDDQLADLLNVGPTDELLSPASCNPTIDLDSGFSGSSSGASYQSAVGSLRRGPHTKPRSSSTSFARSSTPVASTSTSSAGGCSFPLLAPPTMSLRNSHRGAVNGAMMMDSGAGFSGCAGASVSAPGSCVVSASGTGNSSSNSGAGNKSFWSRKGWRKLAGFGSNNNNNKSMTFESTVNGTTCFGHA